VRFRLAPMSAVFVTITGIVLASGAGLLLLYTVVRLAPIAIAGLGMFGLSAATWLVMRPTAFEIEPAGLTAVFPLRRQFVPGAAITGARIIDRAALRAEIGLPVRIGVGGLFGTFGWLWTTRRGMVTCLISRTDGMVWIERRGAGPLLITPERPQDFVARLTRA